MEIGDNLTEKAKYDYKLVILAMNTGDQKAFAELMHRYRESVFFMLLKMTNNKEDADDLTMEAFSKAFSKLALYSPQYAFSTWLFKIATNNCIDFIRKKKNNATYSIDNTIEGDDGDSFAVDIKANSLDPEESFIKKQKSKLLHEVVYNLKPRYKELVELRYFEELSYEEIAERLNLPLGTVKAQLFRSRDLLYQVLKDKEGKI